MQDEACKNMKTNHVSARARHEIERKVKLLAHAKRPRQLSGPSVSYKESHGLGTTLAGNTQKTKELVTEKKVRKIQEIIRFMHRQYRKYKENQCFLTDRLNRA